VFLHTAPNSPRHTRLSRVFRQDRDVCTFNQTHTWPLYLVSDTHRPTYSLLLVTSIYQRVCTWKSPITRPATDSGSPWAPGWLLSTATHNTTSMFQVIFFCRCGFPATHEFIVWKAVCFQVLHEIPVKTSSESRTKHKSHANKFKNSNKRTFFLSFRTVSHASCWGGGGVGCSNLRPEFHFFFSGLQNFC
jgi:hypothetical protein